MPLARRLIPCLDVKDGRVVKGIQFEDLADAGDPAEQAARYDAQGADELVLLDVTASAEARATRLSTVRRVADAIFVPLTVGGGVRTTDDVRSLLGAGADKVSVNTAAVDRPEILSEGARRFGSQCMVLAIDARRSGASWTVYTHGGRTATTLDAVQWARQGEALGAGEILLTSMDRDGTQIGYDLDLLRAVASSVRIPVIASGGVGSLEHLAAGFEAGASAALAASIFHYGTVTLGEAKAYLRQRGIAIRSDV